MSVKFLDSNANEYSDISIENRTCESNEILAEIAGQHVLDMIIEEYDRCDIPGYVMPEWLTGGVWGFVVGPIGGQEVVRFDWPGCLTIAEEEIKNRPPKIIVPDKNIFVPGSLK